MNNVAIVLLNDQIFPSFALKERPQFHLADGTVLTSGVKLMTRTSYSFASASMEFQGLNRVGFQAVAIPYKVI